MNGAQDLGGTMGHGPVAPETDEPVFHADWEQRAFALTLLMGFYGQWNIDRGRFERESLPPAQYLSSSYFQIWLAALEKLIVQTGFVTPDELSCGKPLSPARDLPRSVVQAKEIAGILARGGPADRPAPGPARFKVGDRVRTRNINPETHTRLARYLRGRAGQVVRVHGAHVFPDSSAHGKGDDPQWLYSVSFSGRELWGEDHHPKDCVFADVWEPYLE